MGFGFNSFSLFQIMFFMVFILILTIVIMTFVQSIKQWRYNNQQPRLSVDARVVAKRTDVSHHQHPVGGDATGAHGFTTSSTTWYYVTFEVESGDRMELEVDGNSYGMMAEGDYGKLSFQGTRFLSFDRYR